MHRYIINDIRFQFANAFNKGLNLRLISDYVNSSLGLSKWSKCSKCNCLLNEEGNWTRKVQLQNRFTVTENIYCESY